MVKNVGMSASPPPTVPGLQGRDLALSFPGYDVFTGLSLNVGPGLNLVRGGDGRGKTSVLQMIAGERAPSRGRIEGTRATVFWIDPRTGGDDKHTLAEWLQAQQARHPAWDAALAARLAEAFGLAGQEDKAMYMLSTGTRRKALLVAAFASGAALTLLDTPWAALDARGRELVTELLEEAAHQSKRAFVVADGTWPEAITRAPLAGGADLGD